MTNQPRAAEQIRLHLQRVNHLRDQAHSAGLASAVHEVKQLQARRFRATYRDFLLDSRYAAATRFFLEELYGEHNFSERDAQFGRIAGAIERLFPAAVGQLAVDLAETHALTETLDHELAGHWLEMGGEFGYAERYVRCWRLTGQPEQRARQLAVVQHMGQQLQQLTCSKSLLIALKMMRQPAQVAGLSSLQHFLERGFDAFGAMGDASVFLGAIQARELQWMAAMFEDEIDACQAALTQELARA